MQNRLVDHHTWYFQLLRSRHFDSNPQPHVEPTAPQYKVLFEACFAELHKNLLPLLAHVEDRLLVDSIRQCERLSFAKDLLLQLLTNLQEDFFFYEKQGEAYLTRAGHQLLHTLPATSICFFAPTNRGILRLLTDGLPTDIYQPMSRAHLILHALSASDSPLCKRDWKDNVAILNESLSAAGYPKLDERLDADYVAVEMLRRESEICDCAGRRVCGARNTMAAMLRIEQEEEWHADEQEAVVDAPKQNFLVAEREY